MTTPPRVLFHSPSRRGLGHVMRGANLARAITQTDATAAVLLHVANGAAGAMCGDDVPWIASDPARAGAWPGLVAGFCPSLVVFDTILPERWADDTTARAFVWRHSVPARHHETLADARLAAMRVILVPHTREEFGYELPKSLSARAVFTGPIVRKTDAAGQARVRERCGLENGDMILTSTVGGGGFDASASWLLDIVLAAHDELAARLKRLRHILVRGPLSVRASQPEVRAGLTVIDADPDLVHLMAISTLVVAEAGYNTVQEIQQVQVPALLVPGERRYDDQLGRAAALEANGVVRVIGRESKRAAVEALVALATDPVALAGMRERSRAQTHDIGNARAAQALLAAAR
jgi:predicted glycosyltransferase